VTDLPTQRDFDDFAAWPGRDVLGPGGDRLGAVELIFLDEATGVPEWVLVRHDDGTAFVPLAGASVEERSIRVEQERERVAAAPQVEVGETLSVGDEKRLYEHYGLDYSREASSTVLPEGASVEAEERPRLRKYIGAPVPASEPAQAPASEPAQAPASEPAQAPASEPAQEPASVPAQAPDMAPRNLGSATPAPLPPAAPRVIPPEGGFQALEEQPSGSRVRLGISAALAGALAGLIAVLAWRRRR
jgi:hypothetical protein